MAKKTLHWVNSKKKLKDLIPDPNNPRVLSTHSGRHLTKSLEDYNLASVPLINTDNKIIAGHQRISILKKMKGADHEIDVRIPSRKLTKKEAGLLQLRDNKNQGDWDWDMLANHYEMEFLEEAGFRKEELLGYYKDDFETDFYGYDDTNAEMPITPKYNEKYSMVAIFCDNALDENWLINALSLKKSKCYKSSRVKQSFVITVRELQQLLEEHNV